MVAIARYLNVTLIVPELDKTSFWKDPRFDPSHLLTNEINITKDLVRCLVSSLKEFYHVFCSEFHEIFDVDHFITSLRDEVRILKELPPRLKRRVEKGQVYSMPPISWSNITYYHHHVSYCSQFVV